MNISAFFIRRPVTTSLLMFGLAFFGVASFLKLPVSDLPNVDFPTILVVASLPGASPETMASSVATPLEREFSTIAGVDTMTSTSILGNCQITLVFNLDRNIDAAAQDVQAAIARAESRLPPNMPTPPSYQKVNPADQPILFLAITSSTLPLYTLDDYAQTMMAQRLSTLSGVAQVLVYGTQKFAVRVQVSPEAIASRQIGIDEVVRAVQAANVNLPVGTFQGPEQSFTVKSSGQLFAAAEYAPTIVAYRQGNPVRLNELGAVLDSVENDRTAAWYNGLRGVVLAIQRQPGTNTVDIVDRVHALLPQIVEQLPASAQVDTLYDRSESIRHSVGDVKFTLVLTLALVVMVIFVFLRNLTATLIPSIAMILSIVGTFAAMYLLHFSLDNLSLMALTLSVGFVVDDAIVVLENIVRHVEMGKPVMEAAVEGSREIGFTVVSMTLSLVAVFIPVLFLGGLVGRLLNEFAVTIALAILISGAVSLSLSPLMCSRFLRRESKHARGALYAVSERFFDGMLSFYEVGLRWALRHRALMMLFSAAVLIATAHLFAVIPKGFLPSEDTGRILVQTESAEGTSFDRMVELQNTLADIVRAEPSVESFMSVIGSRGGQAAGVNTGILFIRLKPREERAASVDELIAQLRPKLNGVPGIAAYPQNIPPIRVGGQLTKSPYQLTLQSLDADALFAAAPALADKMRTLPGVTDVSTDLQLKDPQVTIRIDRDRAAALGVTPEQIELTLAGSFGSRQISTIYGSNNQYQVILELEPRYRADPDWLSLLHVRSNQGRLIPLRAVADIGRGVGPLSVNHLGQLPAATISFNLAPGFSLGPAVDAVTRLAHTTLPPTITTSFQGTAQAFQSSIQGLGLLLVMAILVTYMVLGMLYESFVHPITILTALPFAGFGALVTLMLFKVELSLYAFVGVIMLIGLVKKNGIMMVDFAIEAQRHAGKTPEEAIYDACVVRFRPIMMTTMAALLGTLPIAVGYGAGAESRRPLGLAVVGGLLFSQLVTLYATPVFYLYLERVRMFVGRRRAQRTGVVTAPDEWPAGAGAVAVSIADPAAGSRGS